MLKLIEQVRSIDHLLNIDFSVVCPLILTSLPCSFAFTARFLAFRLTLAVKCLMQQYRQRCNEKICFGRLQSIHILGVSGFVVESWTGGDVSMTSSLIGVVRRGGGAVEVESGGWFVKVVSRGRLFNAYPGGRVSNAYPGGWDPTPPPSSLSLPNVKSAHSIGPWTSKKKHPTYNLKDSRGCLVPIDSFSPISSGSTVVDGCCRLWNATWILCWTAAIWAWRARIWAASLNG